jgi:hypothetical protein
MTVAEIFTMASGMDRLVRTDKHDIEKLARLQLQPEFYSRDKLFRHMARGEVSLFSDFPVYVKPGSLKREKELVGLVANGFTADARARTQNGPSRTRKLARVPELMDKWKRDRAIISVTDLHFRETKFEKKVEADALSDFNIYCFNNELVTYLEMMTMVISSSGNVTDSHTDDSDGSNHCFTGKKLWLCWDRVEGQERGLQDVTFDDVHGAAKFSIKNFLQVPSAQWFVVSDNRTLFLPGNLTHRVITLEKYIGIGSFHVALPSYIRSLRRWILTGSTDVTPALLEIINREVVAQLGRLKDGPQSLKDTYGLSYVKYAVDYWKRNEDPAKRKLMLENRLVKEFLAAARAAMEPAAVAV